MSHAQQIGERGEALACAHLEANGYHIVTRNWRGLHGEIDIVALREGVLAFVEVKTRRAASPEAALPNFTPRKRAALLQAIYAYLEARQLSEAQWRVDLIVVALPRHAEPLIEHLEDALEW